MGKARILGLIIDRREVGDPGAFDDKTDEELMEEAKKRADRARTASSQHQLDCRYFLPEV